MTPTERDLYRGLARTLRTCALNSLRLALLARDTGDSEAAQAWRRQARGFVRDARRWDAVAEMNPGT